MRAWIGVFDRVSADHHSVVYDKVGRIVLGALIFWLFAVLDPFGLASSTSEFSKQLVHRLASLWAPPEARRHLSVVVVDDRSAAEINRERGYPITFAQHARILRPILCAGPSALFIDVTFRGMRTDSGPTVAGVIDPELQELIDVLGGARPEEKERCRRLGFASLGTRPPTRIFIARIPSSPPSPCDPFFGRKLEEDCRLGREVDRLSIVASPVPIAPIDSEGAYPLVVDSKFREASAALAMVLAHCNYNSSGAAVVLPGCTKRAALEALLAKPVSRNEIRLQPTWAFFQTEGWIADRARFEGQSSGSPYADNKCGKDQAGSTWFHKLEIGAGELWRTVVFPSDQETLSRRQFGTGLCLPMDTFSALDVRQMATFCGPDGTACRERLGHFFSNRMIFYGIDITGVNDAVRSPVLGPVPGVAMHAAVAENLVRLGDEYHALPEDYLGVLSFDAIWDALIVCLALSVTAFAGARFLLAFSLLVWGFALCSLVLAWGTGLSMWTIVVGTGIIFLWFCGIVARLLEARGDPHQRRLLASVGDWFTRLSLAGFITIVGGIVGFVLLRFPPANAIATVLIAASLPSSDK